MTKPVSCKLTFFGVFVAVLQCQLASGFIPLAKGHADASALRSSSPDDTQQLLEKAQRLRQEAEAMESKLRSERGSGVVAAAPEPVAKPVKYQQMPGTTWSLTYRFADEPVKDRDEDAEPLDFYRGQLNLLFRTDGYTELISEGDNQNGVKVATRSVITQP